MKVKVHDLLSALGLIFLIGIFQANCKQAQSPERGKRAESEKKVAAGPVKFTLVYQTMMLGETKPCG